MISTQVTPPGGWQFTEDSNVLLGNSFDELVSILKAHRKSNGKSEGLPEQDIKKQLYDLHPSIRVTTLKMISNVR